MATTLKDALIMVAASWSLGPFSEDGKELDLLLSKLREIDVESCEDFGLAFVTDDEVDALLGLVELLELLELLFQQVIRCQCIYFIGEIRLIATKIHRFKLSLQTVDTTLESLMSLIRYLNADPTVHGILVQLLFWELLGFCSKLWRILSRDDRRGRRHRAKRKASRGGCLRRGVSRRRVGIVSG